MNLLYSGLYCVFYGITMILKTKIKKEIINFKRHT